MTSCAYPRRTHLPAPAHEPGVADTIPPPHVTSCREYADNMAGRQLDQDKESITSNFQGGDGGVLNEFARMDAERYYRQLYESCLSQQRDTRGDQFSR